MRDGAVNGGIASDQSLTDAALVLAGEQAAKLGTHLSIHGARAKRDDRAEPRQNQG